MDPCLNLTFICSCGCTVKEMGVVLGELGQSTIESLWLNIYGGVY